MVRSYAKWFAAELEETIADRNGWIGRLHRNLNAEMGTISLAETESSFGGMSGIFKRTLAKMQNEACQAREK